MIYTSVLAHYADAVISTCDSETVRRGVFSICSFNHRNICAFNTTSSLLTVHQPTARCLGTRFDDASGAGSLAGTTLCSIAHCYRRSFSLGDSTSSIPSRPVSCFNVGATARLRTSLWPRPSRVGTSSFTSSHAQLLCSALDVRWRVFCTGELCVQEDGDGVAPDARIAWIERAVVRFKVRRRAELASVEQHLRPVSFFTSTKPPAALMPHIQ